MKPKIDTKGSNTVVNRIGENIKVIEDYKNGKNVNGFIMGLVMKKTGGKVNPGITNMVLKEELEKL